MKKLTLLLLACLICPSFVFAFPDGPPDREERKEERAKFLEELGVTPEQKDKLEALKEGKEDFKEQFQEVRKLRDEMQELLKDPNSSDEVVLAKSKEIAERMSQGHEKRIKHLLEMKKILTPEQFSKLLDKMHKKFDGMRPKFKDRD